MVPMPHPHSLKKNTLKALKKCMAVEEETGIELITPPIWHELNKGTADTYVGLFASTPETFELRITFLTQGGRDQDFFLQLRVKKSAAGAHGSAGAHAQ